MTSLLNENYLDQLVGEGKKYKDNEALARSRFVADEHIERLERENAALRNDYEQARTENMASKRLEELYDQIATRRQQDNQPIVEEKPQYDERRIESLIDNRFRQMEEARTHQDNLQRVRQKLEERYGQDYTETLKKNLEQLDLTPTEADELAKRKPSTFIKMLGLDSNATERFQSPPSNTQLNTTQRAEPKRTWSYYQQMKRENPKLYHDPQTNIQMLKDAELLGDAFADGDFNRFG